MPEFAKYDIEQWIKTIATGEFYYKNVCGLDRAQLTPQDDAKIRKYLWDFCHASDPIVEPVGRRDGFYRPIENNAVPVDWQDVKAKKDFPVILPFDLRKHVFIYPNTTIVVAGAKSAGKTGFLYRTVALNMLSINTILLSNMEGGREQMRDRFGAMNIEIPRPAPFTVYPVSENFHDYIKKPNSLYVIDYIDAPEGTDFYLIGASISKVRKRLNNSVAVIGLQKPFGRDLAFGKEQTLKDSTLYLALDSNKLKIVDAKVPTDKKVHPKNMQWTFQYDNEGTNFVNIQPYHGE